MHQRTKFRKDRSNRCGDIAICVIFQHSGRRHLGFSNIRNFNGTSAVRVQYASLYEISSKSVKTVAEIWRFNGFLKWWSSAILDLLGAYWDHPRRPLDGLHRCAKCGRNRCRSFDNLKLAIFCPFGFKNAYSRPKNWGFGGILPPKWGAMSTKPPKGTSLRESASFEPSSVKICRRV